MPRKRDLSAPPKVGKRPAAAHSPPPPAEPSAPTELRDVVARGKTLLADLQRRLDAARGWLAEGEEHETQQRSTVHALERMLGAALAPRPVRSRADDAAWIEECLRAANKSANGSMLVDAPPLEERATFAISAIALRLPAVARRLSMTLVDEAIRALRDKGGRGARTHRPWAVVLLDVLRDAGLARSIDGSKSARRRAKKARSR